MFKKYDFNNHKELQMQTKLNKHMRRAGTSLLLAGAFISAGAQAEVTLNAGLKLAHETNINGSPVKSTEGSDTYTTLNASAVYYTPLDSAQTTYFIGQVGAFSSTYNKFDNLDNTALIASAGLYKQLSSNWSGQITGRGFNRDTKQSDRDSTGWGTTLEIKNQLTPTVWIKGVADYEDSSANRNFFSYTGQALGLSLGYLPLQNTFVSLGYSHGKRDFDTASTFKTTTRTSFLDVSQRLAKNWYLNGAYAYQDNTSNIAGTAYKNQVLSVAINFSY